MSISVTKYVEKTTTWLSFPLKILSLVIIFNGEMIPKQKLHWLIKRGYGIIGEEWHSLILWLMEPPLKENKVDAF